MENHMCTFQSRCGILFGRNELLYTTLSYVLHQDTPCNVRSYSVQHKARRVNPQQVPSREYQIHLNTCINLR